MLILLLDQPKTKELRRVEEKNFLPYIYEGVKVENKRAHTHTHTHTHVCGMYKQRENFSQRAKKTRAKEGD